MMYDNFVMMGNNFLNLNLLRLFLRLLGIMDRCKGKTGM